MGLSCGTQLQNYPISADYSTNLTWIIRRANCRNGNHRYWRSQQCKRRRGRTNFAVSSEESPNRFSMNASNTRSCKFSQRRERGKGNDLTASDVEEVNEPQEQKLGSFTGQFAGTVHNDTADLSAGFALFVQDTSGNLSGCLAVVLPLGGSGPIVGSESGSDVSFVATSNGEKITFTGKRTKAAITGTYVVEKAAGSEEEGKFYAKRTKILDKASQLDFANCPTDADLQSTK